MRMLASNAFESPAGTIHPLRHLGDKWQLWQRHGASMGARSIASATAALAVAALAAICSALRRCSRDVALCTGGVLVACWGPVHGPHFCVWLCSLCMVLIGDCAVSTVKSSVSVYGTVCYMSVC